MKVSERCGKCNGFVEADDQPMVIEKGGGLSDKQGVDRASTTLYRDGSGIGSARQFVEKWRAEHRCAALGVEA